MKYVTHFMLMKEVLYSFVLISVQTDQQLLRYWAHIRARALAAKPSLAANVSLSLPSSSSVNSPRLHLA